MARTALDAFIEKEFGGRFTSSSTVYTVGTTAVKLLQKNYDRLAAYIGNLSSNDLYLDMDSDVSTTEGLGLIGNGSSVFMGVRDDLILPGLDWFGISSASGSKVYVLEIFAYKKG